MIALRDGHIDLEEAKIFRSLKVNIPASTKFEDRGIEISGEWNAIIIGFVWDAIMSVSAVLWIHWLMKIYDYDYI